jgi:solute carrier family 13 (sodium-dependent dicarboxylate transporter), member 2/3/5
VGSTASDLIFIKAHRRRSAMLLPEKSLGSTAMAIAQDAVQQAAKQPSFITGYAGLLAGIAVLLAILLMPEPAGLPVAGQRMLAIFGFAVVIWITEAVDYAISAVIIAGLMAVLLGTAPDPAKPQALIGTVQGLTIAMNGFSNTALTLVAAALFLAAAMTITGLDRRIALMVMSKVGALPGCLFVVVASTAF